MPQHNAVRCCSEGLGPAAPCTGPSSLGTTHCAPIHLWLSWILSCSLKHLCGRAYTCGLPPMGHKAFGVEWPFHRVKEPEGIGESTEAPREDWALEMKQDWAAKLGRPVSRSEKGTLLLELIVLIPGLMQTETYVKILFSSSLTICFFSVDFSIFFLT